MCFSHEAKMIHPLLSEVAVLVAKASATYNPIIYALSHSKVKAFIRRRYVCEFNLSLKFPDCVSDVLSSFGKSVNWV